MLTCLKYRDNITDSRKAFVEDKTPYTPDLTSTQAGVMAIPCSYQQAPQRHYLESPFMIRQAVKGKNH